MTMLPGAGYGGYYKLSEIIEKKVFAAKKVLFEFRDGWVFVDGKIIQGLRIIDTNAYIKAIHYTSWENATQIRSLGSIKSSLDDPFVYLAPRGVMQGWPENEICKELGAKSANTEIWLEIVVPVGIVWLKASRRVVHFAVQGDLLKKHIVKMDIQRRSAL
ncbi:MAG: hypothetical protein QW165_03430 [Candidatus Woesearchaeota archaeon]